MLSLLAPAHLAWAAPGDEAWSARYDLEGLEDVGFAVAVSSDGSRIYVGGWATSSTSGSDFLTRAYDATTGQRLWTKRFSGPGEHRDQIIGIALGPDDGLLFVTGSSEGSRGEPHYRTIAYAAASGRVRWMQRLDHVGNPRSITVSPDGRQVFVTGDWGPASGPSRIVTVAYRAATGEQAWVDRFERVTDRSEIGVSIAAEVHSRRVFVAGIADGDSARHDYVTISYRTIDGSVAWTRRYDGPASGKDEPKQVAVSPDGSAVFVTGTSKDETPDYATVAYAAGTGQRLWTRRYDGNGLFEIGFDVVSNGDAVFVTGRSDGGPTGQDAATIAYDAHTGESLWRDRYDGPDGTFDGAVAVANGPDGSQVFVVGSDTSGGSSEFATIAYASDSGQRLWDSHYQGPGGGIDNAIGLAVDPLVARVFVTGASWGGATGFDVATVAYAA